MAITKKRTVTIPIYGYRLRIVFAERLKDLQEAFPDRGIPDCGGCVFAQDNIIHAVFVLKETTPGLIAHESKHVVNKVFIEICQSLDLENDEAECYLLSWIVNRIHETMPK